MSKIIKLTENFTTKGNLLKMINEDIENTVDYGYLHPAIVTDLYNTLADNNIFLAPEMGETYGGRHFYIIMKNNRALDVSIVYNNKKEPTINIYTKTLTEKGLSMEDAIELILSHKDEFIDFDEAIAIHKQHYEKWNNKTRDLNEDDSQMMLQQDTLEFNQKVEEDLTPEEYKEVLCSEPSQIELPNIGGEENKIAEQFRAAAKTATFAELMQAKKQIKALKKQQQAEQVAAPALVTILGVSMNPGVAIALGTVLFVLVLSFLSKLFRTKRTTYYCDGTRSRGLFGLLRW